MLAVHREVDANPLIPIQRLYEIERGKAHTQSDQVMPDYTDVLSALKARRGRDKKHKTEITQSSELRFMPKYF